MVGIVAFLATITTIVDIVLLPIGGHSRGTFTFSIKYASMVAFSDQRVWFLRKKQTSLSMSSPNTFFQCKLDQLCSVWWHWWTCLTVFFSINLQSGAYVIIQLSVKCIRISSIGQVGRDRTTFSSDQRRIYAESKRASVWILAHCKIDHWGSIDFFSQDMSVPLSYCHVQFWLKNNTLRTNIGMCSIPLTNCSYWFV